MVAGPLDSLIDMVVAVWKVLVLGTFRFIPRFIMWLFTGDILTVVVRVTVAVSFCVFAYTIWVRMADSQESQPLLVAAIVAIAMMALLIAIVGYSTGLLPSLRHALG